MIGSKSKCESGELTATTTSYSDSNVTVLIRKRGVFGLKCITLERFVINKPLQLNSSFCDYSVSHNALCADRKLCERRWMWPTVHRWG